VLCLCAPHLWFPRSNIRRGGKSGCGGKSAKHRGALGTAADVDDESVNAAPAFVLLVVAVDTHAGIAATAAAAAALAVDEEDTVFFITLERRIAVPGPSARAPS